MPQPWSFPKAAVGAVAVHELRSAISVWTTNMTCFLLMGTFSSKSAQACECHYNNWISISSRRALSARMAQQKHLKLYPLNLHPEIVMVFLTSPFCCPTGNHWVLGVCFFSCHPKRRDWVVWAQESPTNIRRLQCQEMGFCCYRMQMEVILEKGAGDACNALLLVHSCV